MKLTRRQLDELRQSQIGAAGNRLANAIEIVDTTQVAVAKGTSLPYTYVSDVTRGRYPTITVENARKFADHFGCSIEDLFPARETAAAS